MPRGTPTPGLSTRLSQSLLTVVTDDGATGYCFGAPSARVLEDVIKPAIIGEDPMYRERIWKTLHHWQRMSRDLTDRALGAVDMAIWDLVGRALGQPVYKLLGATRDKVPAYASTMCGDEIPGGLSTPEEYGEFALQCKERGYPAFKLHTWMPPIAWAPCSQDGYCRLPPPCARPWGMTWTSCSTATTSTAVRKLFTSAEHWKSWATTGSRSPWTSSARRHTSGLPTSSISPWWGRKPPTARCTPALSGLLAARLTSAGAA